MTNSRTALLAGLSSFALTFAAAASAAAQDSPAQAPQAPAAQGTAGPQGSPANSASANDPAEVVVTGSRAPKRSRLDTIAPVDVVTSQAIAHSGTTELSQALSVLLPSVNFPRPTLTDATDAIRPVTLRGLAPDETLLLVNSKRWHQSSVVNLNGSIGRGAVSVDLNTIPTTAVGTIEVLRDGASAQYGSDAIAGVVNIRLKEANHGGGLSVVVGQHNTTVNYRNATSPIPGLNLETSSHRDDGATTTFSGWTGLSLLDAGFLTVSAESKVQSHTTRAGPDARQQYPTVNGAFDPREYTIPRINAWYGDPQLEQYTLFANAGYDPTAGVHLYSWGSLQYRDVVSAGNFRRPINQSAGSNILSVYPNGFLPKIESQSYDGSAALGATFNAMDWNWDASLTYGVNRLRLGVVNSINVSLGPTSPLSFDAGALQYQQVVGNLGVTRQLQVASLTSVNVAAGLEARYENYRIFAGEPSSYVYGGYSPQPGVIGAAGAQVFPGFTAQNATNKGRTSEAAYVDVEVKPMQQLDIDAAARAEHYSDFGGVLTGKLAGRYDFTPNLALRATVSNGFRAPALQQEYYTATSTNFINGIPFQIVTLPAGSDLARIIGSQTLKPEKSTNASVGGVFRVGPFSATVDAYYIRIKDRITLSENLTQAAVTALFPATLGIGGARFFTNGLDTETRGVEAVANYRWVPDFDIGRFDLTLSASHNDSKITRLPTTNVLSSLANPPLLIGYVNRMTLTEGQPHWKGSFVGDWTQGIFGATVKATYYGKLLQPGTPPAATPTSNVNDLPLQAKTLVDFEFRVNPVRNVQFALGADNLFDVYPTGEPARLNPNGVAAWPEYSPFGFQGRFLYARATYSW